MSALDCNYNELIIWWSVTSPAYPDRNVYNQLEFTDGQNDRMTDRQTDRWTDRQTLTAPAWPGCPPG